MNAIAIDGPSGAGKSTIAKALAKELSYIYVDTGALYRAIGLYMLRSGIELDDSEKVIQNLSQIDVSLEYRSGEQRVILNGRDVSEEIRLHEVSMAASKVSALPEVRQFLLELQRDMAKRYDVVMDGRDIGTVILPEANLKIFLTASAEDRARRRTEELLARGQMVEYEQILKEVNQRDYDDSHRDAAPLRQAEDAVLVDTTGFPLEKSISTMIALAKEKLGL